MINDLSLESIIEAALFAAGEPLSLERLVHLFEEANDRPDSSTIKQVLQILAERYASRGLELKEVANGFQFQVRSELSSWIQKLWTTRPIKYSHAFMEILAIIAYKQPVTRGEIEKIRGIAINSAIMKTLLEQEWIRIVGYKEVPGKPALYGTTKYFLDYFNLKSLEELPEVPKINSENNSEIAIAVENMQIPCAAIEEKSTEDNEKIDEIENK